MIIGRPGTPGTASVMQLSGEQLDVAIYGDVAPEAVAKAMGLERGDPERAILGDPIYVQVFNVPGWGLEVLELIKEDQQ